MARPPTCLRCRDAVLVPLPESPTDITFLACPTCARRYAQRTGGALTFAWGHPISLVLYPVLFEAAPLARVDDIAHRLLEQWTPEQVRAAIAEIELELASPTQPLRDILDNQASEELCRVYLASLVIALRAQLA
jgi:hypothetical protein